MTTETHSFPVNKAVLLLIFAGLMAMFVWTFVYRANHPSLVAVLNEPQAPAGMGGSGQGMGSVMQAMQKLQANPEDPAALEEAAEAFAQAEMWDKALPLLEKALTKDPKEMHVLNLLGVTYFRMERPADSAKQFERMLEIEPDNYSAQYNLAAVIKHGLQDPEKAKPYFEKVIANPKADPQTKEQARQELSGN